jgi:GntR family transcriptional regulator/MocR family aminotransferase
LIPWNAPAVIEEPGYPDARAIMGARTRNLRPQPVDDQGMIVDERLEGARLIYTTPSHHYPSNVTMTLDRRTALLAAAEKYDSVILEDDYEPEASAVSAPRPALRSLDRAGRVVYTGSLSKSIMPGLRLGYMVGAPEFIREARALRRMLLRHPPGVNQRVAALFMAARHHDMLLGRIRRAMVSRREAAIAALRAYAPDWRISPTEGGGGLWLECPDRIDTRKLAAEAMQDGVMIEPGYVCFAATPAPQNYFRLGLSVISADKVEEGVRRLAAAADRIQS